MSVFSFISRGRQAAKDHKAKVAEQQKKEEVKTPYKHVPQHAAIDAMSGAPQGWRDDDRPRILEQNRRRSAMTASGFGMPGLFGPVHPGMPRTNSALSRVSYPNVSATPVVHIPRNYSYHSVYPGWNNNGGEVVYSQVSPGGGSVKGKEVERTGVTEPGYSVHSSRSSSKGSTGRPVSDVGMFNVVKPQAASPVGSSSNSTSSLDDLEMKPVKHTQKAVGFNPTPSPLPASASASSANQTDYFYRPQASHSRRTSDSHDSIQPRSEAYQSSKKAPRVTSLPASPTAPPVPALPLSHIVSPTMSSRSASAENTALSVKSFSMNPKLSSSTASSSSSITMTARSVRTVNIEAPSSEAIDNASPTSKDEYQRVPLVSQARLTQMESPSANVSSAAKGHHSPSSYAILHREIQRQDSSQRDKQQHEGAREELFKPEYYFRPGSIRKESFQRQDNGPRQEDFLRGETPRQDSSFQSRQKQSVQAVPLPISALPTDFKLPLHGSMPVLEQPQQKGGKLTKNRDGKLAKKNRWSFRSSNAPVVAV